MLCNIGSYCSRKAWRGFGAFALCRKHTNQMQANRLADLQERGLDPIGHQPTADDLYRWVYRLAINYAA